ncbi:MAG: transcription antitermination factor NusB [Erysipelotrichaceae bacterium]|nr:transcription antitermination factor NusB [Erysipelotrichaceae bacterium]
MNRHEARLHIVYALYQHLLLKNDLNGCFINNLPETDDVFINTLVRDLNDNIDRYIETISPHLKRWTFDRLNYVDQAILLEALSEMSLGLNEKGVIIDEAVRIAKEYSDEDSFKYINGVLDNL